MNKRVKKSNRRSISVIDHISRMKAQTQQFGFLNTVLTQQLQKKVFDKIHHAFMIKILTK